MRWVKEEPLRGILKAAAGISVAAVVATVLERDLDPSAELLRTAAGVGASFLLAYVIEAAWIVTRLGRRGKDGEPFMGLLTGFAVCGLMGIVYLLVLSERTAPQLVSEDFFLWWAVLALLLLGLMIVIHPALTHLSTDDD